MKAILPVPRAIMAGAKARVTLKAARYGTSIMARASSGEVSTSGSQRPAPALLIRMSGVPFSASTRAAMSLMASEADRSMGCAVAVPPASRIAWATPNRRSALRASSSTWAPAAP
ncbi:hypothetical protein AUC69_14285 [Methyloceanibacter superfactus]|uniref:Uncharacterized protein n=1 Tax=Methyloceanibacter superfactus TaxID=1774969 RepID=A0A1E3VTZ3_9HYPH|nr:hypothetical protein AUC69_14285 [Methyloceanibacter superfactus]